MPSRSPVVFPLAVVLALTACASEQGALTNRMEHGSTAYLARAARQPVRWQVWGSDAFAIAARLDRPLLLVVGAERCRPCAEMESVWDDPALAGLVNTLFVPVRVDRDDRPDVARRYQAVVRTLTGLDGYPLTVFLTADGGAFFGGTTFPADDPLTGRGLRQLLPEVARGYRERREFVVRQAAQVQQLAAGRPGSTHGLLHAAPLDAAITSVRVELERAARPAGVAHARAAGLLFTRFALTGDTADLIVARATLDRLIPSLDAAIDAPDVADPPVLVRAALLRTLVQGWAATHDSVLLYAARRVIAPLVEALDRTGHSERAGEGPSFTDQTAYVAGTVLAAGPAVGDSMAPLRAQAALDSLLRRAYGRGLGARHATVQSVGGLLQDQVQLAAACLAAWETIGERRYLAAAEDLVAVIEREYAAPLGGYHDAAHTDMSTPFAVGFSRQVLDDLLPAANPWAARLMAQLAAATGERAYARRATATLEAFAGGASSFGMDGATYLETARIAVAP